MAEYIDREKMLKYIEENNTDDEWIVGQYNADWIYSFIESQPTADVVEVKHGEWKYPFHNDIAKCTNCGFCVQDKINNVGYMFNFCPNCGAKMDGGI